MRISDPIVFVALVVNAGGLLEAQQSTKPAPSSAKREAKAAPSASTSTPEIDVLKKWVGNWEATIESTARDGKAVTNAAKATAKLSGGRWLVTDFDGTFMGAPFIGHEVIGYDPVAKKYVLNWVDSMATSFATGEGLYNSQTKTLTLTVTGRDDSTGKMTTWRQVDIWKDADHHDWSLRTISAKEAKEQVQMTIRYHRQG
ncbi:MAG TPA: DUF1579 family protein [Planctomycetaceae bacterium]|jgi:hypothetical protein|nr:DUF1579 family protein [Planctomycetaceae bacterium]